MSLEATTFRGLSHFRSLDNLLLGMGDEDRRMKARIWVCSSQLYGLLQRINTIVSCHNYLAVLVCFYSSIVSHSMSEKTLFVAHGKHEK